MSRQDKFEKRKERNLKKLSKQVHLKETSGGKMSSAEYRTTQSARQGGKSTRAYSKKKSSSAIRNDSFEGVKDGVANKVHCDPHSTSSNLALQSINFPGASPSMPTYEGMHQYLTMMNTHPLLQTALTN